MRVDSQSLLVAGALLFGAAQANAATPEATQSAAPAMAGDAAPLSSNALRLSELLNPADRLLDIGLRAFDVGVKADLKNNPEDAAFYDENPGFLQVVLDAGRPIIKKHLIMNIPAYQRRFARFYADHFTAAEIDQLISFYSTPTGAKAIAAMYARDNLEKVADAISKGGGTLTAKQVEELYRAEAAKLPNQFDADDWKALFIFGASPVAQKLKKLAPEFSQLVADVQNEPDPAMDADMDAAITAAVNTYMDRKEAQARE